MPHPPVDRPAGHPARRASGGSGTPTIKPAAHPAAQPAGRRLPLRQVGSVALVMLLRRSIGRLGRLGTAAIAGAVLIALATWWAYLLAALFAGAAQAQTLGAGAPLAPTSAAAAPGRPSPGAGRAERSVRPPPRWLADPTRPPAGLATTGLPPDLPGAPGAPALAPRAGRAASLPAATAASAAAVPPLPRLQALRVASGGVSSALIDGQLLQQGELHQGWRVQQIDADGVLLQPLRPAPNTPSTALRLSLLPPLATPLAPTRP
ncbi:MAG: hypothetical protein RIQ60_3085 [Pseudomonadota bacterium]|jgi:hypothetical protein